MIKTDYIKCPLCNDSRTFHKSGIQSHFKSIHKISWLKYKQDNLNKFCEVCGKKLLLKTQRFCSRKCSGFFASTQVKNHKNSYSDNTLSKQYLLIDDDLKNEIINCYMNNDITKTDLIKKYDISREFINLIFKEKDIKCKTNSNAIGLINKNKKLEIELFESDIAKQIVEEYKNNETASFRSLDKKYYLSHHFSRTRIKKILQYYNVETKDASLIRKKVWEEKIARGDRHPNYGKNRIYSHSNVNWYFYKGMHFQGSYEFKFALWLENKGINFLCHSGVKIFEYVSINGRKTCYHPDFYLPETEEYIEIKGFFSEQDKKKLEIVKKTYPNMKLRIYTVDVLKDKSILDIDRQLKINIEEFRYDLKNKVFYIEQLKNKISKEQFIDKFVGESKNITKIAEELNENKHLIYVLYKIYKIPRTCTKEFQECKTNYLLDKFGQQIKFDFLVMNLNQKELEKKYSISNSYISRLLSKFDLSSKTVKASI